MYIAQAILSTKAKSVKHLTCTFGIPLLHEIVQSIAKFQLRSTPKAFLFMPILDAL